MKLIIPILVLAFTCSAALANDDSARAAVKAEKQLKAANKSLKAALTAYRARAQPESQTAITADQAEWRQRVEKECTPVSDGSANAGSAAEFEYAEEIRCQADAAGMRAKALGIVKLLF